MSGQLGVVERRAGRSPAGRRLRSIHASRSPAYQPSTTSMYGRSDSVSRAARSRRRNAGWSRVASHSTGVRRWRTAAVGADEGHQPAIHLALDEADLHRVERSAPPFEDVTVGRRHRRRRHPLVQRRRRRRAVRQVVLPGARSRRLNVTPSRVAHVIPSPRRPPGRPRLRSSSRAGRRRGRRPARGRDPSGRRARGTSTTT